MTFKCASAIPSGFLEDGDKVKVTVQFKAREITHPELGRRLLDKMIESVGDKAVVEKPPSLEGKMLTVILAPKASVNSGVSGVGYRVSGNTLVCREFV